MTRFPPDYIPPGATDAEKPISGFTRSDYIPPPSEGITESEIEGLNNLPIEGGSPDTPESSSGSSSESPDDPTVGMSLKELGKFLVDSGMDVESVRKLNKMQRRKKALEVLASEG